MPFVNEKQQEACYAKNDPKWNCKEWSGKTDQKSLPKGPSPKRTYFHKKPER